MKGRRGKATGLKAFKKPAGAAATGKKSAPVKRKYAKRKIKIRSGAASCANKDEHNILRRYRKTETGAYELCTARKHSCMIREIDVESFDPFKFKQHKTSDDAVTWEKRCSAERMRRIAAKEDLGPYRQMNFKEIGRGLSIGDSMLRLQVRKDTDEIVKKALKNTNEEVKMSKRVMFEGVNLVLGVMGKQIKQEDFTSPSRCVPSSCVDADSSAASVVPEPLHPMVAARLKMERELSGKGQGSRRRKNDESDESSGTQEILENDPRLTTGSMGVAHEDADMILYSSMRIARDSRREDEDMILCMCLAPCSIASTPCHLAFSTLLATVLSTLLSNFALHLAFHPAFHFAFHVSFHLAFHFAFRLILE